MEAEGRIRISSTRGAHVTSACVLDALRVREERKKKCDAKQTLKRNSPIISKDYAERKGDIQRLLQLADRRHEQRKSLVGSRRRRRRLIIRKSKAHLNLKVQR